MYRNVMQIVVEPTHLAKCPIEQLPGLKFLDYVMPVSAINFGYEFRTAELRCPLNETQITHVKERCRTFVVELIKEIQMRLPENIDCLLMLGKLHPKHDTSQCKDSISSLAAKHRSTFNDMDQLENEWQALCLKEWSQDCMKDVVSFWAEVNEKRNSVGQQRFSNISSLALALLSLPFSNASVERIFSQMNVVHNKLRNRLVVRSVEAILQIRYGLKLRNETCVTFEPPIDMIKISMAKDVIEYEDCDSDLLALADEENEEEEY